jgi:hypothetical protein
MTGSPSGCHARHPAFAVAFVANFGLTGLSNLRSTVVMVESLICAGLPVLRPS